MTGAAGRRKPRVSALAAAAELSGLLGVLLLGFVVYMKWGLLGEVESGQHDLSREFSASPVPGAVGAPGTSAPARPADGHPLARLSIPRLGLSWIVVEGVRKADLRHAPGHYPGTQLPGETGNFAVAGHRSPGLFWDLDQVRPGDRIQVESGGHSFEYRVDRTRIVSPGATEVLRPDPDRPDQAATAARITLTTCNPRWDNYERLVVSGLLAA